MRKALIIGINEYPSNPLNGCVNDALRISHLLEKNEDDSPNFDVKKITKPKRENLNSTIVKKSIKLLFNRGEPEIALFYFSGHGKEDQVEGNKICLPNSHTSEIEEISMQNIYNYAAQSSAREKIIILDCCYSGGFGRHPILGNQTVLDRGISIMSASREDEPSYEVSGKGIFSSLFCDALEGGAADVIGEIKLVNVYAYIDEALGAWDQRPIFKTNVSRFTKIRQTKPYIQKDILRKLTDYFSDPEELFDLDPSFEPDATPSDEKNEKIFKHLQKYRDCRLLEPVGADHMYFAAINNEKCRLTPLGKQYWRLVDKNKI
ncbi:caspase family protein [Halarsenatibacter silvermanii]|uniref:Caspase domain-containing protein n=1 Tax=Halarsenatibacter silvermanii TaxID=321763 RepID=A0A1G9RDW9_9FIRM|nr:caspase family protein [Halarsenatibacter silvermanii]SDM21519.1 Caspase domain-containing protein [Halarsenatibacter silvermanii]